MKPIHYIIAASLILNIALFIYTKPFTPSASAKTPATQRHAPAAPAFSLQTATPEQLIQTLPAMGFPPDIVVVIVRERIRNALSNKQNSIMNVDTPRYWDIPFDRVVYYDYSGWVKTTAAQKAELNAAVQEHNEAYGKLLDAFPNNPPDLEAIAKRDGWNDIPGISREQLIALCHAQQDWVMNNNAAVMKLIKSGTSTEEQRNQVNLIRQQYNTKISQILTPDQFSEYDIRNSVAGKYLGYDTNLFDTTEQEYRDIYAVYQEYYKNAAYANFASPEYKNFTTAEGEQLQQILGSDRYAELQQSNDPAYQKLYLITQRLDLPLSAAREVVSTQTDLTQRAAAIDADPTLTPADRAARYTALAQEAQTRITKTLGADGYTAYRQNSQNWIQTLESGKPPPTAPAK